MRFRRKRYGRRRFSRGRRRTYMRRRGSAGRRRVRGIRIGYRM